MWQQLHEGEQAGCAYASVHLYHVGLFPKGAMAHQQLMRVRFPERPRLTAGLMLVWKGVSDED